ncbi:hypothetical protein MKX01_021160 [Papaver californicum]|nr:hypothetical protein MKX01_021160 [Papaver californicum]
MLGSGVKDGSFKISSACMKMVNGLPQIHYDVEDILNMEDVIMIEDDDIVKEEPQSFPSELFVLVVWGLNVDGGSVNHPQKETNINKEKDPVLMEGIDLTQCFQIDKEFDSREAIIQWCQEVAGKNNTVLATVKLGCERSGVYSRRKSKISKSGQKRKRESKKCGCPLKLRCTCIGGNRWKLRVSCGKHNHEVESTQAVIIEDNNAVKETLSTEAGSSNGSCGEASRFSNAIKVCLYEEKGSDTHLQKDTYEGIDLTLCFQTDKGKGSLVELGCVRSGAYRSHRKKGDKVLRKRKVLTKKCQCPFKLRSTCHSYFRRWKEDEDQLLCELTASGFRPRQVLQALKEKSKENFLDIKTIYNRRTRLKLHGTGGSSVIQQDWENVWKAETEEDYVDTYTEFVTTWVARNLTCITYLPWTRKIKHFGYTVINRVENERDQLKKCMESLTSVNLGHRSPVFSELRNQVSQHALELIQLELDKSSNQSSDMGPCRCLIRSTHGLPCPHEVWKNLSIVPRVETNADFDWLPEVQLLLELKVNLLLIYKKTKWIESEELERRSLAEKIKELALHVILNRLFRVKIGGNNDTAPKDLEISSPCNRIPP